MRAIVQAGYGAADVLHAEEIDQPAAGEGGVLVRVRAGLDRGTWHLMAGQPYLVRLVFGLRKPKNRVPGLDVAGTVVALGAGVTRFQAGDEVFGVSQGSFAEYAPAQRYQAGRWPDSDRLPPCLRVRWRDPGRGSWPAAGAGGERRRLHVVLEMPVHVRAGRHAAPRRHGHDRRLAPIPDQTRR